MIQRKKYLDELIKSKDNGFPKVITGMRRCGKSYLLKEIYRNYLIESEIKKENILYLDLESDKNVYLRNPLKLGEFIRDYAKNKEESYYVFLDEIQRVYSIVNPSLTEGKIVLAKPNDTEIVSFVDVILGLSHEENIDLYVTGSNSKMLSTDILTQFRDKATNIHLSPLSFEEYYSFVQGSQAEALTTYMQYGGMPLAVLKDNDEERRQYLLHLFETTFFKDILEHHQLRESESLNELCNIISHDTGSLLNSQKIANTFHSVKHENISKETVDKYLGYFKDAFLVREVKRYDIRGRKEIGALRKYYFTDLGLRNARLNFAYPDEGLLLENVIYNELMYHNFNVNVGSFDTVEKNKEGKSIRKTNEIDFYVRKGNRVYDIQVTDNISESITRLRELRPFLMIRDHVQKILVINKPIKETLDENGFTIIGAIDFMLRFLY